jgi:hypothetical protein
MGIRFLCPNGHKLNVKEFLAGKRAICPHCGQRFYVPTQSMPELRVASARRRKRATDEPDEERTPGGNDAAGLTTVVERGGGGTVHGNGRPGSAGSASAESIHKVDPLAEAPQASWFVRHRDGPQFGPAQADVVRRWIAEGRVPADALVWREGWSDWRQANSVFDLEAAEIIGSEFDFDPAWLMPAGQVDSRAAESDDVAETPSLTRRIDKRQSRRQMTLILSGLIVAVLALLPVLIYVVTR